MKTFVSFLLAFAAFSCAGPPQDTGTDNGNDTGTLVVADTVAKAPAPQPTGTHVGLQALIDYVAPGNQKLAADINALARPVLNPALLASEADLDRFFADKDSLVVQLDRAFSQLDDVDNVLIMGDTDNSPLVLSGLSLLGLLPVGVEGMFGTLADGPVLEERMREIASEPYRLYRSYQVNEAATLGGEYPYMDLTAYGNMLLSAEEMLLKFPDSPYSKKVKESLKSSVTGMVDVHLTRYEGGESHHVGGICYEDYPCMTDISYHQAFVENHPGSVFAGPIRKMLNNMSVVESGENMKVFAVVTAQHSSHPEAELARLEALLAGKDWLHVIDYHNRDGEYVVANCHRFFPDLTRAEASLAECGVPGARIVAVGPTNDYEWGER